MLKDVLKNLRKTNHVSQEYLSNELHVTRQTIAKWEKGESVPDIYSLQKLCQIYNVSVDEVLNSDKVNAKYAKPLDKFCFGYVTIDKEGKITLPPVALKTFKLKEGSKLILFGDLKQGLALVDPLSLEELAQEAINLKE